MKNYHLMSSGHGTYDRWDGRTVWGKTCQFVSSQGRPGEQCEGQWEAGGLQTEGRGLESQRGWARQGLRGPGRWEVYKVIAQSVVRSQFLEGERKSLPGVWHKNTWNAWAETRLSLGEFERSRARSFRRPGNPRSPRTWHENPSLKLYSCFVNLENGGKCVNSKGLDWKHKLAKNARFLSNQSRGTRSGCTWHLPNFD